MMYNYYLSLPLAIGITLLNTNFGLTEVVIKGNELQSVTNPVFLVANQASTENPSSTTTAQAKTSSYLGLMNAGYVAHQKQDYLAALNYFRQALTLQPGDSQAEKAVKNISSLGFDLYMRTGYAADRIRDYSTALQNFQKALQIRPDSLHAKQAVSNVTYYLAQQPVNSEPTEDENKSNGSSLWLMLFAIAVASGLSAVLLFYLFRKTDKSLKEAETNHGEVIEPISNITSESPVVEPLASNLTPEEETIIQNPKNSPTEEKTNRELIFGSKSTASHSTEDIQQPSSSSFPESDNNNSERTSIVSSSSTLARLDIVPELIQDLTKSDRSLRRKAVWELAQRGDSRAMKPLVELMVEVDSQERGLILEAMTQIAGRTLKPMNKAIMMSLQDENAQVKQNAIRDLTRVYELMSQITKRLSEAVEDSDAQVQETAKWALQKLNQMPAESNSTWQKDDLTNEINNLNSNNGTNGSSHRNKEKNYPFS